MVAAGSRLPPRFDLQRLSGLDDPYPTYAELRHAGPLCRGGPAMWVVPRYDDVVRLIRDPRLRQEFPVEYHELSTGKGPASEFFHRIILYRDPPAHTRLRQLIGQAFTAGIVRALEPRVVEVVDELLAPARDAGFLDVVADLAFPLPITIVCELMGIPPDARQEVRDRAADLGRAFVTIVPDEARAAAHDAVVWLRSYMADVLDERRRSPAGDLLSRMLVAEDEEGRRLAHNEIVDNAVFSFFAGFETTTNLIANGVAALLRFPDQWRRLVGEPGLVATAVDEFLRFDAPIQGVARMTRVPVDIGDRTIREGRILVLLIGSANHDELQFARPDALDVARAPNHHVSFGGGVHHCMGAALARLEGAIVFRRLLHHFRSMEAGGVALRRTDTTFRAYASVPVRVSNA